MRNLARHIREIGKQVPVYAEHWAHADISPDTVDSLAQVPVIDKRTLLQAGVQARLDRRFGSRRLTQESTSGSSGEPMQLCMDSRTRRRRRWRFLRTLFAAGYRPGDRLLLISTQKRSNLLSIMRWTYADLRMGPVELLRIYQESKPEVLYGPLRALLCIGERLAAAGCRHRPRLVISTAEQLRPPDQRMLRDYFGTEATDFYGMTEIGLYAWRAAGSLHYNVVAEDILSEFVPIDAEGTLERLLVTTLSPCAMPLVRFDTGDLVRRDRSVPGCPISEFVGREIDDVQLADGSHVSPYRLTLALEAVGGIARYQIVQQQDLSVDVNVRVAAGAGTDVIENARGAIAAILGGSLTVRAGTMPADADGLAEKFRPVRSYAGRSP
jgi:phenylacetate-CoA ligase